MRFVLSVWVLSLSALLLFTCLVLCYVVAGNAPPLSPGVLMVACAWVIGLTNAAALHLLYRRAERAIRQAARDEAVVHLAGAVAHELNQPLTVIISSAELMSRQDRSPEEIRAVAQRMSDASQRVADIVSKLQMATCYRAKPYVGNVQIVDLDRAS